MISLEWFKARNNLTRSARRYRFETITGIDHGLHYLWLYHTFLSEQAIDGDLSLFTPKEIAKGCEWTGDPVVFLKALHGAGFIENCNGHSIAGDWWHENGRNIREIARGRKVAPPQDPREKYAKKRRGRPVKPPTTDIQTNIDQKDMVLKADGSPEGFETVGSLVEAFERKIKQDKLDDDKRIQDRGKNA